MPDTDPSSSYPIWFGPVMFAVVGFIAFVLSGFVGGCAPSGSPVGFGFEAMEAGPPHGTVQDLVNFGGEDVRVYYDRWDRTNAICNAIRGARGDTAKYNELVEAYLSGEKEAPLPLNGCAVFLTDGGRIELPDNTSWDCLVFSPNLRVTRHELRHCLSRDAGHGAGFNSVVLPVVPNPGE